jgi:hypothetical protein
MATAHAIFPELSMTPNLVRFVAACLGLVFTALPVPHAQAQQPAPAAPAASAPATPPISQEQLDALLAPIALYPDELLSQVLMASTYPLDIVEAARFVKANPTLKGDALDNAIKDKNWDPSIQSLAAFPQVLDMMNDKLDWTQQLGDAFLADQARVMQTAQNLRAKAQAAGNLKSTEQQKVIVQEKTIIIQPAQPSYVYVPVYNPTVVYGPWWVPAYRPWFWYPPPIYGYPPYVPGAAFAAGVVWGSALAITANHWGWCNTNWRGGDVNINVNRNNTFINNNQNFTKNVQNGNWQHNAAQRKGVAYKDAGVRGKYQNVDNRAVQNRQDFRGRDTSTSGNRDFDRSAGGGGNRPETSNLQRQGGGGNRPETSSFQRSGGGGGGDRQSPAFNSSTSRQQAQMQSDRGASSRASMGSGGGGRASMGGGGGGRGGGGRGGGGRR